MKFFLTLITTLWATIALADPGYLNPPVYGTGYITVQPGSTVATKVLNSRNPPTNLNILTAGPITTWTVTLPFPAFDGQIISIGCPGGAVTTLTVQSTAPDTVSAGGPTSCTNSIGYLVSYQYSIITTNWILLSLPGTGGGGGGIPGGIGGQIQYNNSGAFGGFTITGDAALNISTGALTITSTNGTAFGTLATLTPGANVATALTLPLSTIGGLVQFNGALGKPSTGDASNLINLPFSALTGTTGAVTNAMLVNSTLTINTIACTLGSPCTLTFPAASLTGTTLASNVLASSLTSVGTLTGGTTGTGFTIALATSTLTGLVPGVNGGTGVANTGKTFTLGANLTTTGAGATTLAFGATGNTYTFPNASDTVDTLAAAQSITGLKTFNNSSLAMLGSSTGATTFASANASATAYTITFPAITDTVDMLTATQTLTNKTISAPGYVSIPKALVLSGTAYTGGNPLPAYGGLTVVHSSITGTNAVDTFAVPYNSIFIDSDTAALTGDSVNSFGIGFEIVQNFGGTGMKGGRAGLYVQSGLVAKSSNTVVGNQYSAITTSAYAQVNDNGTSPSPVGALSGINPQCSLLGTATFFFACQAVEADIQVVTGASTYKKTGLEIVRFATDAVQGYGADAAIYIDAQGGAPSSGGWVTGLAFSTTQTGATWPMSTTGTLIGCPGNCGTTGIGIDFTNVTFATGAIRTPGFKVSPIGVLTVFPSASLAGASNAMLVSSNDGGAEGGQIELLNTHGSAITPGKFLRVAQAGDFQILNNAYTTAILDITDAGQTIVQTLRLLAVPTSAGTGGLYMCVDNTGVTYKKASCP